MADAISSPEIDSLIFSRVNPYIDGFSVYFLVDCPVLDLIEIERLIFGRVYDDIPHNSSLELIWEDTEYGITHGLCRH